MPDTAVADAPDVQDAFEAALARDAQTVPPEMPAPPRHAASADPEAPHGRGEDGEPLAPYGIGKNGRPRIKPAGPGRGNRSKDEPRTRDALPGEAKPAKGSKPAADLEPHDFSAGLMEAGEAVWFGGSILAKVGPQVPIVGKFVPGQKLDATMAVFNAERPRLAAALNLAAQHDAKARKLAAKLSAGELSWQLGVMFMVAPAVSTIAAVWAGDKALAERDLPGLETLAKANADALDKKFAELAAQMQAAQLAAQQQAADQLAASMQNGQAQEAA